MWPWKKKRIVENVKEIKSKPIEVKLTSLEQDKIYIMKIAEGALDSALNFMDANKDFLAEKKIKIIFITEGMELYEIEKRILVSR